VLEAGELLKLQKLCRKVYVEDSVRRYAIAISRATRSHDGIRLGASPRASLGLHLASQALAAIRGRNYVIPDDVKHLAIPVMAHRLIPKAEARLRGHSSEVIVRDIISAMPVPVEDTN
jgi:MoxR-like ATPase